MSSDMARTALYRHFAADGRLLYVGISLSAIGRLAQHRETSHWYGEIARVDIEWHSDRNAAMKAEKNAIQNEHPPYNIIHSRAQSPSLADDQPLSIVWPIPSRYAVIAWDFDHNSTGNAIAAVAVGYQSWRCGAPQWLDGYAMTTGAVYSSRDELTESERKIAVLSDYFMLTYVYGVHPYVATRAFMNIKEFRDAIESSPLGPNLMCDLEDLDKENSTQEKRYWHSVHVFPRSDLAMAA